MNGLKMCECGEPTYSYKCELCQSDDYLMPLREKKCVNMNNQIQELIRQAGTVEVCRQQDHGVVFEEVLNAEKFAELIIQECVNQVEQATSSPFVSLDDAKRMSHFVAITKHKIVKHFGVKK